MNKLTVLFPGQGSQYVGMGKYWFDRYPAVRQRFEEASEALNIDIARLCFEGPAGELKQTENTQVALVTVSVALFETAQKELGLRPSYLAGHSIGELAALSAAGVFSFADAVRLARVRGEAMASCDTESATGMMAITKLRNEEVEAALSELELNSLSIDIANYNSPTQTILAGSKEDMNQVGTLLKARGAKVIPLNVSGAFHSRYMAGAIGRWREALHRIEPGKMQIPVVCGHEGRLYTSAEEIKESLVKQLTSPIRWTQALQELSRQGVNQWLDIGPKDVLGNLVHQTIPGANVLAYDDETQREEIRPRFMATEAERTGTEPNLIGLCLGAAVCTKNTNWDESAYRQGVIEPYKEIQQIHERLDQEKRWPTEDEMERALSLLATIFKTKGTPAEQQSQRFRHILNATGTEALFPQYFSPEGARENERLQTQSG
ncbi:ACP S-malonyltransferase [Paenibacillus thiaminolyticus]|uniref:ACP S-malonyltransferase n=1 Tax=Paenibacillus thiaminolyticus TaxID=49283 RepID=UPI0025431F39|nr:ACP S-malonyltransferase [Paenibacillus thiaminolyticus]WII34969.1 ACP S-malonyltransferase [Paenibacillus thiaminolyticus]